MNQGFNLKRHQYHLKKISSNIVADNTPLLQKSRINYVQKWTYSTQIKNKENYLNINNIKNKLKGTLPFKSVVIA